MAPNWPTSTRTIAAHRETHIVFLEAAPRAIPKHILSTIFAKRAQCNSPPTAPGK